MSLDCSAVPENNAQKRMSQEHRSRPERVPNGQSNRINNDSIALRSIDPWKFIFNVHASVLI